MTNSGNPIGCACRRRRTRRRLLAIARPERALLSSVIDFHDGAPFTAIDSSRRL
jgi:hypothetical protein